MLRMEITHADIVEERGFRALIVLVLVGTSVGGAIDLYLDAPESWWSVHAIYELVMLTAAMAMAVVLWHGWRRSRRALAETRQALEANAVERETWRASAEAALAGFAHAVDDRLSAWGLTPTEREIALRLLKGHSHKQIAFETGRSERTVRQHAVVIYQKSGLRGRAELSAFFLDDILLPAPPGGLGTEVPVAHGS
jgi:DNA-binding CsgD family transcriptional regulator